MIAVWNGDSGKFFTKGREYEFRHEDDEYVVTIDDENDPHSWTRRSFDGDQWTIIEGVLPTDSQEA